MGVVQVVIVGSSLQEEKGDRGSWSKKEREWGGKLAGREYEREGRMEGLQPPKVRASGCSPWREKKSCRFRVFWVIGFVGCVFVSVPFSC